MAEIIRATWDDLTTLIASARRELMVCTPYYTSEGIGRVFDHIAAGLARLRFITRLSPSDWLRKSADPEELVALLSVLAENHVATTLTIHQRVHAKVYVADSASALLGSANLSGGGFEHNFELMARLDGNEVASTLSLMESGLQDDGREVSLPALASWVNDNRALIGDLDTVEQEATELAEVQRSLDRILRYGTGTPIAPGTPPELEAFVGWLEANDSLPGAQVLLNRHHNRDRHNLTGHFKQGYYGTALFLIERSDLIEGIAANLARLTPKDIYQPQTTISAAWIQHIDAHACDIGDRYDYAVLRGYLPPALGGTREGGGGGSSTLKRLLPLVAQFLEEGE